MVRLVSVTLEAQVARLSTLFSVIDVVFYAAIILERKRRRVPYRRTNHRRDIRYAVCIPGFQPLAEA